MAIIYWVTPHLDATWGVKASLYLSGAFVIGIGMSWLWELPTLKLRDLLFPSMLSHVPHKNQALVRCPQEAA